MSLEKKLLKKLRTAIYDFDMIQDWETVILWVSWGKDSMVLWYLLSQYLKYSKAKFTIKAIYIFKDFLIDCDINFKEKQEYFEKELNIPLERVVIKLPEDSKLNDWVGQSCQWCAYARRIAMFNMCKKYSATKIIYGHHMDDIVVTSFMNMIEWRKLKIMPIKNKMNLSNITFIRPMAYIREKEILRFAELQKIPYSWCNCPVWTDWNRNKIKHEIIWKNEQLIPKFTENIFWALCKDFREKYEKDGYSM